MELLSVPFILAQVFGFLAVALDNLSIQVKKKENGYLLLQIATAICFIVQYALLGSFTVCFLFIVSCIRTITYYFYEKKKGHIPVIILYVFMIANIIVGVITYQSTISYIPIFCNLIYTYSAFQKDIKVIRISVIIACILFIFFNFYCKAYVAFIGVVITLVLTIYALLRDRKNKEVV